MGNADFLCALLIHESLALSDEMDRAVVEKLEVVAGEVEVLAPVATQPPDVLLNAVDVFLLFPGGIGVVEAQMELRAGRGVFPRDTPAQADGLGMPDVQVAIRLRRKTGDNPRMFPARQILRHDVTDEIMLVGCLALAHRAN